MNELEQHHIRYEELHGEDEIIMLSREGHMKVHREDKANGFKPIPKWVVDAARRRSPGYRATAVKYAQSEEGRTANAKHEQSKNGKARGVKYEQSEKGRTTRKEYRARQKEMDQNE